MSDLAQIGLVRTRGFTSFLTRLVTHSHWNHCVVMYDEDVVVSAEPSGVQLMPAQYFPDAVWSSFLLTEDEIDHIRDFLEAQLGKPYGTLTYVWIGISKITRWATPTWLEKRLSDQSTWICSAITDAAYAYAGFHLFTDDRPSGSVVPGDIARIMYDFGMVDTP